MLLPLHIPGIGEAEVGFDYQPEEKSTGTPEGGSVESVTVYIAQDLLFPKLTESVDILDLLKPEKVEEIRQLAFNRIEEEEI